MRFDARSFLSISPARWILAATKSPIDQDTASVFMEMRSWPQPVKDRESVLLRRAVSRHTPRRMAGSVHLFRQKDLVGPPYPSPHSLRFPHSSCPSYSSSIRTRFKLEESRDRGTQPSRKNYLSNWTNPPSFPSLLLDSNRILSRE